MSIPNAQLDESSSNGHKTVTELRPVNGHTLREPVKPRKLVKPHLTRAQAAELVSLLNDLETAYKRHVIFGSEHHARVLAAYVVADYCREPDGTFMFPFWLYVYLRSRGTGHGKTRVLKITDKLVTDSSGILFSPSEPALLRAVDTGRMMLWDEAPNAMGGADRDLKRSVLNSGNEQGGYVVRVDPMTGQLRHWSTFGPKMLAGRDVVRDLPDDVLRRTYVIDPPHEPRARLKLERRWLPAEFEADVAAPLRARLAAWADKARPALRKSAAVLAEVPDELYDSMAESWGPLFTITGLAGREWKSYITAAALADVPDETIESATNGSPAFVLSFRHALERPRSFARFADYRTGKRPDLAGKPNGLTARSFGWSASGDVDPIGSLHSADGRYELRISAHDFPRLVELVGRSAGQSFEPRAVLRELRDAGMLRTNGPDVLKIKTRVWASQAEQGPTICIDVTHWFAPNGGPVDYLAPKVSTP